MKSPDRIQWHEGMMLSPQHFQVESARVDSLIAWHTLATTPYSWGVKRLKFDLGLLASGLLRVLELEALLPDGTAVHLDANDPAAIELSMRLDDFTSTLAEGPLPIYLCLPVSRQMTQPALPARFISVASSPVQDEVSDAMPADIPRLVHNISLAAGDVPSAAYVSMRLGSVIEDDGVMKLGPELPELLDVAASPELLNTVRHLVVSLRSKAAFLARQAAGMSATEQRAERPLIMHRLSCLVPAMPGLEALLQSPSLGPYPLYLALCNLLGPLSLLRPGTLPTLPPPYDHGHPHRSFIPLLKEIEENLSEVSQDYREVGFAWTNGVYELAMQPEWIKNRLIIGVKGQSATEIEDWMESAVIGANHAFAEHREKRILGLKRTHILAAEELQLRSLPGVMLYEILPGAELLKPESRLVIGPSGRAGAIVKPSGIVLFIRGTTA
jgi:type VI secretion system protein ImpJ